MHRNIQLFFVTALLISQVTGAFSQVVLRDKNHSTFQKGIRAADQGNYSSAMKYFKEIISQNPDHIDALTQLGVTYMESNQNLDSTIILLNKVLTLMPPEDIYDPFGVYLHQIKARTYNLMLEPRKALDVLNIIKDSLKFNDLKTEVVLDLKQTTNAILLLDNPIKLEITDLGPTINSQYDDHSPLVNILNQQMYFTSRRPIGNDRKLPDNQYFENIFTSKKKQNNWQKPTVVKELIKRNEHLSILSLSADGEMLFLYKDEGHNSRDLFVSHKVNNKWQDPEKLPYPINSKYNETHASLSPDMSTLYFTSNRPGGYGGLDIYEVKKDIYGKWGQPKNLGSSVNTAYDEETPMIHADGKTLYFNSNGPFSMGGVDVLYSQKLPDSNWTKAVNLGYPINSPDDDIFFMPTLNKNDAYLATYRFSENQGHSNIYHVQFKDYAADSLVVIEGSMKNPKDLPLEQLRIIVWRTSDDLKVGEFRANPHTGKYMLILNAEQTYKIQEVGPEFTSDIDTIHITSEIFSSSKNKILMLEDVKYLL